MPRSNDKRLLLAALVAFTVACGSGGDSGTPDDGGDTVLGPETVAEFCDTLYGTYAQRWADCSKAPLAWATWYIDKAKLCANMVAAADAGLASYDRGAAGRCLAVYEGATCTDLRALWDEVKYVADCEAAITGKVGNSGATFNECNSHYECVSGFCGAWGSSCPDGCYEVTPIGSSCNTDQQCGPSAYCYYGSLWPVNTCQPYTNRAGLDQECRIGSGCKPGLFCDGSQSSSDPGTCKAQLTAGTCAGVRRETAPGYGCFSSTVQALLGPGESCNVSADYCGPGLYCGPGAVCTQEPFVGEACVYYNATYQGCIGGYCNTVNCVRSVETCYWNWECESDGYCISGVCQNFCAP